MLAQTGLQLVKELKRSQSYKIPAYNEEKIRICLEEMNSLYEANCRDVSLVSDSSDSATPSSATEHAVGRIQCVIARHAILERNKRCLLAYHHARLMYIKSFRWLYGTVLPKNVRQSLSEAEQAWFKTYCGALANFMQAETKDRGGAGGLDLTQSQIPPKSLFLEVRCLVDFGEFETEDGSILQLTKDSHHLMSRADCELLIRQGVLEHITC
ncbi:DNA replication complex GINS protein PSF1 [Paragonimus heterotremus]|uniref:DNA replication complex GINS protein PSF1 n=1 Tax=Paragonimus heterotremus TaxID=100268 RepID=A0A8J4WPY4_9TREM|nr:DNA replication complex GINS protein PSF1 [Paragonimus heterotremus]